MRQVSYGEMSALSDEFEKQCEKLGICWTDEDVMGEAFCSFVNDYQNGDDDPQVILCGYGYECLNETPKC